MGRCQGAVIRVNGDSTVQFSVFELDLRTGELRRNGSRVRLQEQPFQILVTLLEQPGEVVTRDELRRKLWPADTFVDFDHGLNAAIRRLRDALSDSADTPRFIETVARRGYRFIAPVKYPQHSGSASSVLASAADQHSAATWKLAPAAPPEAGRGVISHRRRNWLLGIAAGVLLMGGIWLGWRFGNRATGQTRISQRRLTANPVGAPVLSAVLSPSGKYLAFADTTGIYLRQVDSGETHPIPLPTGFAANPVSWFPDDNHLLVWDQSAKPIEQWNDMLVSGFTNPPGNLWKMSVLGGEPRLLTDRGSSAVVSPDGTQIAFVRGSGTSPEIWLMQSDGEKPTKLFACDGPSTLPRTASTGCLIGSLTWSPGGEQIAYVKQQFQMGSFWSFEGQLEILDLASRQSVMIESHVGPALAWTPDGRIIYAVEELPPNQSDSNLWSVRVSTHPGRVRGVAHRITTGEGFIADVSSSADGKRLAILRRTLHPDVYITHLSDHATRLSAPQLLTLDERQNYPTAWTPDSESVLFFSLRDGVFHIFKQAIDQAEPELLVGGSEPVALPRLSPDGSMVLYVNSPSVSHKSGIQRIMRVPVSGGPPQLVLEGRGINNLQCARLPSTLCLYSEIGPDEEHFYTFDPLKGKGEEIAGAAIHTRDYSSFNWSLSPDGKMLAFSKKLAIPSAEKIAVAQDQQAIRLFSVADAKQRNIPLPGWAGIVSLDWSADGESVWATAFSGQNKPLWTTGFNSTGTWTLLKVDLSGKVSPMLQESKMTLGWAIPSPDGSKLALWEASGSSNVWLVEGD